MNRQARRAMERPIIFSAPMVRAILDDEKTQTRQIIKPVRGKSPCDLVAEARTGDYRSCPWPDGGRLWVRESFSGSMDYERHGYPLKEWGNKIFYWADGIPRSGEWTKPRSPIHMPRCLSRITLEITDIRAERLQDITEADARAEGITDGGCLTCGAPEACDCRSPQPDARDSFANFWMGIHGSDSWHADPWVWVICFRPVGRDAKIGTEAG